MKYSTLPSPDAPYLERVIRARLDLVNSILRKAEQLRHEISIWEIQTGKIKKHENTTTPNR